MTVFIEEKDELEVTADLLSNVPDTYQKNVGYFIWDFMRAIGIVFTELWKKLSYLTSFFNIEKLEYDDLVKFVFQRAGITAHTETHASGEITCLVDNFTINEGDIFETSSGLQFESLETKTCAINEKFHAQCVAAGAIGNVPANTITIATVSGLSVINEAAFTGGYDKESAESIIDRYYTKIQKPITSGNKYHYEYWAKEVTGVGKVKIKPLWDGNNTVKIIITDTNSEPADANLVQAVQDYIDPYEEIEGVKVGWGCGNGQAPVGAYCTCEAATPKVINISVLVKKMAGVDDNTCIQNITNSINTYINSTVFDDDIKYISYSKINGCVINTDGVYDCMQLLINGDTDNIVITDTSTYCECAVLGTVSVTFYT